MPAFRHGGNAAGQHWRSRIATVALAALPSARASGGSQLVHFADVLVCVRAMRETASLTDIGLILGDACRQLGFNRFALAQTQSGQPGLGTLRLSDFPDDWVIQLAATKRLADDPVLLASQRSVAPFGWNQLDELLAMNQRQRAYMQRAAAAGLTNGFTVPLHAPGEASGLVSFVTSGSRELPQTSLAAAHHLACFAFEAARRLHRSDRGPAPALTQRQLDCLVLVARGKSNWVAGQLLGLSGQTVHKYVEAAKTRYGVATRTELVVRALHDGQICFADVLH
jgi:LuxR family quorum-sensing system transcriptional regulator CciR